MPPIDDRPVPCEGHEDLWHNGTNRKLRRRHPQFSSRSHREIVVTDAGENLDEPGSTFLDCGSSPGTTHKRRVRILLPTLAPFLHTICARSGRTSLTRLNPPPQIFKRQQFAGPLLTLVIISHETRGSKTYSQPPQPVADSCACGLARGMPARLQASIVAAARGLYCSSGAVMCSRVVVVMAVPSSKDSIVTTVLDSPLRERLSDFSW